MFSKNQEIMMLSKDINGMINHSTTNRSSISDSTINRSSISDSTINRTMMSNSLNNRSLINRTQMVQIAHEHNLFVSKSTIHRWANEPGFPLAVGQNGRYLLYLRQEFIESLKRRLRKIKEEHWTIIFGDRSGKQDNLSRLPSPTREKEIHG